MKGSAILTRMGLCAAAVCFMALAIALPTMVKPLSAGGPKPSRYPLKIEVLGGEGKNPVIVPMGGEMLSIALKADIEPLGIARRIYPPVFPGMTPRSNNPLAEPLVTGGAFMVFDDPDGCLSMVNGACIIPALDCTSDYYVNPSCAGGVDETFLEFIPGVDLPGYGAVTGFTERLPGLVVLSDTGIGNEYNADGSLASPRVAFNLASNVGSVAYLLRDAKDNLPIVFATITPPLLAKVQVDRNVTRTRVCAPMNTVEALYRVDGGPIRTWPGPGYLNVVDQVLDPEHIVTCRIFVVEAMNGPNPPVALQPPVSIVDMNHDGIVSAEDAVRMGYRIIADEQTVRIKVVYEEFFGDPTDLDGNGCAPGPNVLPGSPGGITRVPS